MTTAGTIVTDAYRQGNLIPVGSEPIAAETTEGLALLNRIVKRLFGYELGEKLYPWPVPPPQRTAPVKADYPFLAPKEDLPSSAYPYPPINSRLMCSITSAATVYMPHEPCDGALIGVADVGMGNTVVLTLDGNGRKIAGSTTDTFTQGTDTVATYFYRDDTGEWTLLDTDLIAGDEMPLPSEHDDYFVCQLSIALAPRNGKTSAPETIETRDRELARIKQRYRQTAPQVGGAADTPRSVQSYDGSLAGSFNPFDT